MGYEYGIDPVQALDSNTGEMVLLSPAEEPPVGSRIWIMDERPFSTVWECFLDSGGDTGWFWSGNATHAYPWKMVLFKLSKSLENHPGEMPVILPRRPE